MECVVVCFDVVQLVQWCVIVDEFVSEGNCVGFERVFVDECVEDFQFDGFGSWNVLFVDDQVESVFDVYELWYVLGFVVGRKDVEFYFGQVDFG